MELIDFDAHFSQTLSEWIEANRARFKNAEAMEDAAPEAYQTWLETPADWLGGVAPIDYFARFDDAKMLTDWLLAYANSDTPIPDLLLDRLEELNNEAPILALLRDEAAPCEARMHAVDMLRQLDSRAPMVDYIRWQVERAQDEDLLDNALESLRSMGEEVRRPAKIAFVAADDAGKEALLDVLADFLPCDEDALAFALRQFQAVPEKRALYAGYLGKMEDDRALAPLMDMAEAEGLSYIDFIEIRNAIERLGGEAPVRDFDDPTYHAVKRLQKL
ncbi:MAG TPA: hypothetical protein PLP25_05795 [Candidatus Limiplasma sp.]|nr:hypothetical protein [Candidatus Limiplasma sp.]HPS81352.1 hypothetical protein [Candidatus Limiplasma sp.]